jgi:hypothetical protein
MLIKAVITTYSAGVRRRRIAIVFDGTMALFVDAVIRLHGRRAAPQSAGLRESPVVIHGYN